MTHYVRRTTPSEAELGWLAGIIDGEGSLGAYKTNQNRFILGVTMVNTDTLILDKVEHIYQELGIDRRRYVKSAYWKPHHSSHKPTKKCYEIVVRKRAEVERLCQLLIPHLAGEKKKKAEQVLRFIKEHPPQDRSKPQCLVCKKETARKSRTFCSQKCWHEYAIGERNPNHRHGKYIQRV